ncbi:hypothetical protein OFR22_10665 [Brachyspira hyodysenteriae]|uniref:Uncharacterized protein n=2 Tax=Brachyspira hyodysenteriae TaxID=159 RepID=A0A3B6VDZ4_BRAHW|nr:hypothetical protein [Brachyspira hyodysenteriae]ACN83761.1 hypothetical protein BHWA1_01282 [Brachyspira hyodysenteriae WA1]ANN64119.1 hypothetical protein BHYOB78_09645 [Brachyspira hyodysenteriae ATCC 27164]AUJ49495.1 hypothetical protein BH718_01048 [Brachyspira hyodysenteriae]KLI14371.1 hypothetical protein SU44_11225 [Brachyspira hyodysenteriae]KLI17331.1 hypothetical protein SU45_06065 [Brachyspira hyodysenteriae]
MKKKLKKLLSFIPLFIIIILILWYKSPINGIKCYPESVSKIDIDYNGIPIAVTNTNDINFIIKSLNSISLNKSILKINKSKTGYILNIHSTNKNMISSLTIYSSETASIGNFYYTDKNIMLPYEYIKKLHANVN